MRRRTLAAILLGLAASARPAAAEEKTVSLTVEQAVGMALERNLDLQIERVRPRLAHEEIRQAQAEFSPLFEASGNYAHNQRYLNNVLEQRADQGIIRENILKPQTSIQGKLTAGTEYQFSVSAPRIESDHPLRLFDTSYTPMATLSLTQPLLRGFGPAINKVRINQAVKAELQAVLGVQARMLGVIRDVEVLYWEVAYGQKHADVAQSNLAVAEDLITRLQRLKTAGLATSLDVSQAEVTAQVRRADLARAGADLLNAQSQMRSLVDPDLPAGTRVVALESPPEDAAPVDLQEKIDRAIVRRPELRLQKSIIESLELEERQAKNNRLWTLDASAGLSYGGLAGKEFGPGVFGPLPGGLDDRNGLADAVRDAVPSWALGLKLQIPLGNRDSLAGLETARLKMRQEELRLALLKSQVSVEVETSFQEMVAMRSALDSARQAVDLASRQLDAETRNLDAGRSTARRVLEAQDNLAGARNFELRTLASFAGARSRLYAAQALSFEIYRMEMVP